MLIYLYFDLFLIYLYNLYYFARTVPLTSSGLYNYSVGRAASSRLQIMMSSSLKELKVGQLKSGVSCSFTQSEKNWLNSRVFSRTTLI